MLSTGKILVSLPMHYFVASFLHIINRKPYAHKSKHSWFFSPLNSNHETIEVKKYLIVHLSAKLQTFKLLLYSRIYSRIEKEHMKAVFSCGTRKVMVVRTPDPVANPSSVH